MFDKKNIRWILLIAVAVIFFSMRGTIPKEAVADVEGSPCSIDADCPCWGEYTFSGNETAFGIGVGSCHTCTADDIGANETLCLGQSAGTQLCDMTWCFDVEPVSDWTRDNPWAWMKDNTMTTVGIVVLILVIILWPSR